MNEKKYQKRIDFKNDIILKKSEEIEFLKSENEKLKLQLKEKDEMINSVDKLRKELYQNVSDAKLYKKKYEGLIKELKKMKEVMNQTVFKGRWWLIRLLIK